MTNAERQIELLQDRIAYLKTLSKMLERNATFKEVSELIISPDYEDVAEKKVFIRQLTSLMKVADEFQADDENFDE